VLLDGDVPIMTSDLGEVNWNIVPITEVAHIEVLKGAASSIYGSGAISGVVKSSPNYRSASRLFLFDKQPAFMMNRRYRNGDGQRSCLPTTEPISAIRKASGRSACAWRCPDTLQKAIAKTANSNAGM
jgi:hypothetical protein